MSGVRRSVDRPAPPSEHDRWHPRRPSLENPLTWALPIGRVAGITVRVHVLFLLLAIVMILRAAIGAPAGGAVTSGGPGLVALLMAALFVIVLAHEFGHCLACRWTGGVADDILLWPLGGLAPCRLPRRWRGHLAVALAGPAVNLLICVVAGVMVGWRTGQWIGVALPNPLSFDAVLYASERGAARWSTALLVLMLINWTSLVVLLFNLLPIFPLDGGRIAHALLWRRFGEVRALRATVAVGYLGATALGLFGAVSGSWVLLGVAVLGGFVCHRTHRQLQFTEQELDLAVLADEVPDPAGGPAEPAAGPGPSRPADSDEELEVDAILEIIAERGMDGLTTDQRRVLERATERRQAADAEAGASAPDGPPAGG